MKKFLKSVNKTVQSGADAIVNAADLLMLDQIVEKILKKVTLRIRSYDLSTIPTRDMIQSIADRIFEEGYEEFDEKAGISTDEKSNISVRRRNLRRGFKEKLELFYHLFDEYRLQSQEMIRESQQIDVLVNQTVLEVKRTEAALVTALDTPDALEIKYNEIKSRELNSFKMQVYELNLVHHNQEAIAGKVTACEELLDEMKTEFIENHERATQKLWLMIQEEFQQIVLATQEKEKSLLSSLPMEKESLSQELNSFIDSMTGRIRSLLPHGEDHISAISRYMTRPQREEKGEKEEENEDGSLTKREIECEVKEVDTEREVGDSITLQEIRESLCHFSAEVKAKNVEVVTAMAQQVIDTYGYRIEFPLRLVG